MKNKRIALSYLAWTSIGTIFGMSLGFALPFVIDHLLRLNDLEGIVFLIVAVPSGTVMGAIAGSIFFGRRHQASRAFHIRSGALSLAGVVIGCVIWYLLPLGPAKMIIPPAFVAPIFPLIVSLQFLWPEWRSITGRSNKAL